MIPTQYRITIAGRAGSAGASTDGFIDATRVETYMAGSPASVPTTFANSVAKERGNMRFRFLQQQLQLECNIYIENIVAAGANANTAPTSFVFTAHVERGNDVLFTRDELNNNAPLTGVDALKRMIARALIQSSVSTGDIFDPTQSTDDGAGGVKTAAARRGIRVETLTVGGLYSNLTDAAASVTVAAL